MKIQINCDYCGCKIERFPSQIKAHNFCRRKCGGYFASKGHNPEYTEYRDFSVNSGRMTEMNKTLNPDRMTMQTRTKLREAKLNTGEGKTYTKRFGVHEHRIVAEEMLGRKLKTGEVVHDMDNNKRNNNPENLIIFPSQKEHLEWHRENDSRYRR